MDETEFPNFFKVFCIHFLDDAVVSTHTVSCKFAFFSILSVKRGVRFSPPLANLHALLSVWGCI